MKAIRKSTQASVSLFRERQYRPTRNRKCSLSKRLKEKDDPHGHPFPFSPFQNCLLEHKIGIFVLFWPSEPPFLGFSSTKSWFLCAFCLRNPHFRAFRAQNRGFCALLGSGTLIFGLLEHKIGVFVRFLPSEPPFSGISSTKSAFMCSSRGESGIGKRKRGDA